MAILKSLTFTTLPATGANPTLDRRTRIIARLEEQKLLLADPNYTRTVRSWVKKDGERTPIEKQQPRFTFVAIGCKRLLLVFRSSRPEATGIRQRQVGNCVAIARQVAASYRCVDHGCQEWRT